MQPIWWWSSVVLRLVDLRKILRVVEGSPFVNVNMALLADEDFDRALLVALMEELQPAMLLAKVFFSAAGEGRLEGLSGRGFVAVGSSRGAEMRNIFPSK